MLRNKNAQKCCERCRERDCDDDIKRTIGGEIWSCPCHRGLLLCQKCKEFNCQCKETRSQLKTKTKIRIMKKEIKCPKCRSGSLVKAGSYFRIDSKTEIGMFICKCGNRFEFDYSIKEYINKWRSKIGIGSIFSSWGY